LADISHHEARHAPTSSSNPAALPHASPSLATSMVTTTPRRSTADISSANAPGGREMKSRRTRLSAAVAWTSTPGKIVSNGVDTPSRVPSAVVPTTAIASLTIPAAGRPSSTSNAET